MFYLTIDFFFVNVGYTKSILKLKIKNTRFKHLTWSISNSIIFYVKNFELHYVKLFK